MRKIFIPLMICFGMAAQAQVSIGVRVNALFNTSSSNWSAIGTTAKNAFTNPKDVAGFNIGLSTRFKLPATPIFLMPEIYYTNFKSKVTYVDYDNRDIFEISAKSQRIDIPILAGIDIIGPVSIFAGPVLSTNLSNNKESGNFEVDGSGKLSVGYQFGANVKISKIIVNARYEGSFSRDERKFINKTSGKAINYDNRPSMLLLGLGYQF
ncbi:outer membrane beta-barrel protein [Elizabethkingia sp. HX QKY]|uniref:outer membrane beta-barrel protein n=1 Tax=Elizabethkingia TaxID=308865 RepID=UPI002A24B1F6|nr:outer membrane beta-barrel protein [Elizabethkingia sp. HX QKY]MDX8571872.1 outer membrane beta-barrel protein [Elizabethkingia sp. HX QKY]